MKYKSKKQKHRRRSKFFYEYVWGFKKSFKKDYRDSAEFKKIKYTFLR